MVCGLNSNSLTIASLFTGGGLVECGAIAAGYRPIWGIESDPCNPKLSGAIADCYEKNFGTHIIRQPVQHVDWSQLETPNILWASPVCKQFSAANIDMGEKAEDLSAAVAVRCAISSLLPQAFCLENVRNYQKSKSLQVIREALHQLDYVVSEDILNSVDYGVPQSRDRLFLRAVRYRFPPSLPPPVAKGDRAGWFDAMTDLIPDLPSSQFAPWQSKQLKSIEMLGEPLLVERSGARSDRPLLVRDADQPAWTLRASIGTDQKGSNRNDAINAVVDGRVVRLTPRALARLQSVPDWYQLPEEMKIAGPLLGNGVSCLMAQMILESVRPILISAKEFVAEQPMYATIVEDFPGGLLTTPTGKSKPNTLPRFDAMSDNTLDSAVVAQEKENNVENLTTSCDQFGEEKNEVWNMAKSGEGQPSTENICHPQETLKHGCPSPPSPTSRTVNEDLATQTDNTSTRLPHFSKPCLGDVDLVEELTPDEEADRQRLEVRVERSFYECGCALRELHNRRLYRSSHKTFEQYCEDRFAFKRRHCYQLINAASVVDNLCANGAQILPTSERQVRPLTELEPDAQIFCWMESVSYSGGKVPSGRVVKNIVERVKNKDLAPPPIPYYEGDVVMIRGVGNSALRKYDGSWAIAVSINEYTVTVNLGGEDKAVKPQFLEEVNPEYWADIQSVHERIARLQQCDLDPLEDGILEGLRRRTCFNQKQLALLLYLETQYLK